MEEKSQTEASILEVRRMEIDERLSVLAFQGLVNRDGARLFLKRGFWNWPPADDFWLRYFEEQKGFTFSEAASLHELVERYPGTVKGLVVWDPAIEQTKWIAAILAGLEDLLPVGPEAAERLNTLLAGEALPVIEDLRGRFAGELEAARWSVRNLLSRSAKDIVYSVEDAWSGPTIDGIDYAVAKKSFIYSLQHAEGKEPEHKKLIHEILTHPDAGSPVFGWGEPEEAYCIQVSSHDHYVMCAEAPNLSFWAHVPCKRTEWKQPGRKAGEQPTPGSAGKPALEDRHYIAFCMSEGDTPKMAVSVQGGAWLDPARGKIPINWGMNPIHLAFFPALLEFYWDTATENDYFIGGASGAGYTYPNRMPNPEAWMRLTGEYFRKADMSETEAWMHFSRPVYEKFSELSGMKGFTMPCGPFGTTLLSGGKAAVFLRGNSGLNYFDSSATPEQLAEQIRKHCAAREKPSFTAPLIVPDDRSGSTTTGGWNPASLAKVRELLGDEYRIVTLGEMSELAVTAVETGRTTDCFAAEYNEWENASEL